MYEFLCSFVRSVYSTLSFASVKGLGHYGNSNKNERERKNNLECQKTTRNSPCVV